MKRVEVSLDNINFWNENPREPLKSEWTEKDIISHYRKYEKLDDLIKSIRDQGLLEDVVGMYDGENIKVYDGNRRIAALKHLAVEDIREEPIRVYVKVYDDLQTVLKIIDTIHGTGNGASRKRWSSFQRDRFNYKAGFPLASPKAYKFITQNGIDKYTPYIRDKYIEYTTLERILSYKYLKELFLYIVENEQLDILIKVAKNTNKKIDSRNSKNEQSFIDVFGTELEKICEKYKVVQTKLWDLNFPPVAGKFKGKEMLNNNKNKIPGEKTFEVEGNSFNSNNFEKDKTNNSTNYVETNKYLNRNSISKRSYNFFDYSNMKRPTLEVGELGSCLAKLSQLNITGNNFENTIPIAIMYRPMLESHICLLGNKLSEVSDSKKKNRIKALGLESLDSTAGKSLCNENSINKVYDFGKEFSVIKRGAGFDKKEIKRYSNLMGDIAHGKRFYCNFEELVELDKFVKKYIAVIYGILNKIK